VNHCAERAAGRIVPGGGARLAAGNLQRRLPGALGDACHPRGAQAVAFVANRDNDIPLTDVLDANRQLLASQDDLAHSGANLARAAARSFRALGGGWST
jgi:hypothetical protein